MKDIDPSLRGREEGERPVYTPRVEILATPEDVSRYAADAVLDVVRNPAIPNPVLTVPTGNTPLGMYEFLAKSGADFSRTTIINLDEYCASPGEPIISQSHPGSYMRYMQENFYSKVKFSPNQRIIPHIDRPNPEMEAMFFEESLSLERRRINLVVLGIGTNGHIGFNEPGSTVDSRARVVTLTEETRHANMEPFGSLENTPKRAITQGIGNILEGQKIILLATGAGKAEAVYKALYGPVDSQVPASFLRHHQDVTFVLDEAAAGKPHTS